jgi:hypothetical protein
MGQQVAVGSDAEQRMEDTAVAEVDFRRFYLSFAQILVPGGSWRTTKSPVIRSRYRRTVGSETPRDLAGAELRQICP